MKYQSSQIVRTAQKRISKSKSEFKVPCRLTRYSIGKATVLNDYCKPPSPTSVPLPH